MVNKWFDYDLSQYNFYLMPISFFHNHEMQSFSINKEDKQHQNLLKFIAAKEKSFPSDETQEHNISLILETKWVKSKSIDTLTTFKYDPEDPNAISYKVDSEKEFRKKYKIPEGENINAKGFFFENDKFALPENIAVTKNRVILVYNRYEAASYAEGELKLSIPKNKVAQWLIY